MILIIENAVHVSGQEDMGKFCTFLFCKSKTALERKSLLKKEKANDGPPQEKKVPG